MKKLRKFTCIISIITLAGLVSPVYPCESGGSGASSCTYSSTTYFFFGIFQKEETHSVSCGDGYYACCNSDGGVCVENGSPEPGRSSDDPILM